MYFRDKILKIFTYAGVGLALFLSVGGCLQYVPPIPAESRNSPPVILPSGIDPYEVEVSISKSQDPNGETVFKILQVADPDREDILYAYWFLDYQRFPQGALRCEHTIPSLKDSPQTSPDDVRKVDLECRISHSEPSLVVGKFSILQLFLVDRKANISDLLRADGVMKWPEGSKWDLWTWVLKVE